jgi:lipoate-protein ligase A
MQLASISIWDSFLTITMRDSSSIAVVSCNDEQAWNQQQLELPVSSPCFRLWRYAEPGVVLGRSQRNLVSAAEVRERAGISLVERHAGGGAVLTGPWMLSASIVLPESHTLASPRLVDSYRWLGEIYADVLQQFGIAAQALPPERATVLQQDTRTAGLEWACFAGFSPWEVVVGDRKIVGLAQSRKRNGTLFVAGLLLARPDWILLTRALDKPDASCAALAARTTSCAEQLQRELHPDSIVMPLVHALRQALDLP